MRQAYRSLFGFDEIAGDIEDTMLTVPGESQVAIIPPKKAPPIHEDVIREEEENPLDTSSMQDANSSLAGARPSAVSMRFAANFKKSLGAPAGIRRTIKGNTQKIELTNQNKKFAFSGMIGIKRVVPPEVKAAFLNPGTVEGLDDFSDSFFGPEGNMFSGIPPQAENSRKDLQRPTPHHSDISSSLLDFELSRLPSMSKDPTPANVQHSRDNSLLSREETPRNLPPEAQQQFQSWRDIERRAPDGAVVARRGTVLKEQNTMGTAVSTSISSSVAQENMVKQQGIMSKIRPPRINAPGPELLPPRDPSPERTSDKGEAQPFLQQESQSPKKDELPAIVVKSEETNEADRAKWEATEKLMEKYVLKKGDEILVSTSGSDVQPDRDLRPPLLTMATAIAGTLAPPYKMKMMYEPTTFPEEEDEEQISSAGTLRKSMTQDHREDTLSAAGDSVSASHSITSSRRTGRSKGKKKRSKSKSKKKGKKKKSETESRAGSKRAPQHSVKDAASSAIQSSSKKEHDSKSAAGSMVSSSKKSVGKDGRKGEDAADDKDENPEEEEGVKIKPRIPWSGQEVLPTSDPYFAVYMTDYMNGARVWKHGWEGTMRCTRSMVKAVIMSSIMENIMNLFVMVNTILLAMDRYDQPTSESTALDNVNIAFTAIFAAEMSAKLFGLGLVGYFSDGMNYLDGSVVLFSLVEVIFLNGQGALSAFRSLRIFRAIRMIRTLRVLRVARLLRSLRSMQLIIEVIGKTIGSFAYIGLLMLILIFIYALFGMQLFGGKFDFSDGKPRQNFDSFNKAFLTMFQLLTMENWNSVLYYCMRAENAVICAIYLITWIFIGNYILLNLFLAIMLDAFTETDDNMGEEEARLVCLTLHYRRARRRRTRAGPRPANQTR